MSQSWPNLGQAVLPNRAGESLVAGQLGLPGAVFQGAVHAHQSPCRLRLQHSFGLRNILDHLSAEPGPCT